MKKIMTLFLATTFAIGSFAQKTKIKESGDGSSQKIRVTESTERIGSGKNNALVVTIYEATPEEIEKEWKSLTKDYKAKVSVNDGQIFSDNAVFKSISNNTVDIYARSEKIKEGETKFIVGFDLGGAYMTSAQHPEQFKEMKQLVSDFAAKTTREAVATQLKAAQKVLDKLTDDQKDLVKDGENMSKDIENNKQKIEELKTKIKKSEDEIVTNKSNQEKKKQEVEAQKKVVEAVQAKEKAVQ